MFRFAILGVINLFFHVKNNKKPINTLPQFFKLSFVRGGVLVEVEELRTPREVLKRIDAEKFVHKSLITNILIKGLDSKAYSEEEFLEFLSKK